MLQRALHAAYGTCTACDCPASKSHKGKEDAAGAKKTPARDASAAPAKKMKGPVGAVKSSSMAVHRVVELPQSSFKGKKRLLGDSRVETLEGGSDSLASSPYIQPEDDDDDFKSTVESDDEDEREENEGAGGIASSPMLDDSIMSNNATLALDSRTLPTLLPSAFSPLPHFRRFLSSQHKI